MSEKIRFQYDDTVVKRFPSIRAGVVHASGLINNGSPTALTEICGDAQMAALQRVETLPLIEMPSIRAWRDVFHSLGVKPTKHRVAVEALLRRVHKGGTVPSINTLVDIGNVIALRYALPVAVFDLAAIEGVLSVKFAKGTESFLELGADEPSSPENGEVVFVDEQGTVAARRWCWRQSATSAAKAETEDALFVIEGHHESASDDATLAANDLCRLIQQFQPNCELKSFSLSPDHPFA